METDCVDAEGEVSMLASEAGFTWFRNRLAARDQMQQRDAPESRELANWAISRITGRPRSKLEPLTDSDITFLHDGVFDNQATGEEVRFRLPSMTKAEVIQRGDSSQPSAPPPQLPPSKHQAINRDELRSLVVDSDESLQLVILLEQASAAISARDNASRLQVATRLKQFVVESQSARLEQVATKAISALTEGVIKESLDRLASRTTELNELLEHLRERTESLTRLKALHVLLSDRAMTISEMIQGLREARYKSEGADFHRMMEMALANPRLFRRVSPRQYTIR